MPLTVVISHTADTLSHQVAVGPSPPSVNLLQFGAHDSHKMHEGAPTLLGQADTQTVPKSLIHSWQEVITSSSSGWYTVGGTRWYSNLLTV